MSERPCLYDLTYPELGDLFCAWDEPRFRADQVWRWLYVSLASEFEAMTNLPTSLRQRLATEMRLEQIEPLAEQRSATGRTRKVLFRLGDRHTIESVLMHYHDRTTACISTQVGCGMGCTFCATGQGGLARNLSSGEILAQVLYFARAMRQAEIERAQVLGEQAQIPIHPVSHVVLMGMGEPLANWTATRQAIETLVDERGYNLGARRFTVSTVGLVPAIRLLAEDELPLNLAVSLHAADDELRSRLVPINERYPLADLMAAIRDYVHLTGRRVTFEYALISGINDSADQARRLAERIQGVLCHVNLIPLNPTPGSHFEPAPRERVAHFRDLLQEAGIPTTVRLRRGVDIEAGCGQLRHRHVENN